MVQLLQFSCQVDTVLAIQSAKLYFLATDTSLVTMVTILAELGLSKVTANCWYLAPFFLCRSRRECWCHCLLTLWLMELTQSQQRVERYQLRSKLWTLQRKDCWSVCVQNIMHFDQLLNVKTLQGSLSSSNFKRRLPVIYLHHLMFIVSALLSLLFLSSCHPQPTP